MRKHYPRWLRWLIAHYRTRRARPSYLPNIPAIGTGRVYTGEELRKELRFDGR